MAESNDTTPDQEIHIQTSRYRFVNLVLFVLAGLCNSAPTQAFSAIAPIVTDVYQVSELQANINSMVYALMYPIVVFPVNYILQVYGLKVGTLVAQFFMITGILIRLLINVHFYFFIVGTFVTGLGFCFMINSPNKFAITWFPKKQVALINAICVFSIFASDSVGTFTSAVFIDDHSNKNDFFRFFLIQSIIMTTILMGMAIFFKGKPKNPPSYASAAPRQDYLKSLKKLFRIRNYQIMFISMTFIFGCLGIFFTSLSWQLKTFGFSSLETGFLFIVANICGCTGCTVFNIFFGAKNYRRNCLVYGVMCLFGLIIMYTALETGQLWLLYVGSGLFGLSIFPYLTTITDFASQTAFPIGQALSGGSLLFGGQIFGVITSVIFSLFIFDGKSLHKTRIGCGLQFLIMLIGIALLLFSKQELQRQKYENSKTHEQNKSLISDQDGNSRFE